MAACERVRIMLACCAGVAVLGPACAASVAAAAAWPLGRWHGSMLRSMKERRANCERTVLKDLPAGLGVAVEVVVWGVLSVLQEKVPSGLRGKSDRRQGLGPMVGCVS